MKFLRVLIKRNARLILLLTKKGRRISPRPHIYLVLSSLTFDTSLCVASCFTSSTPLDLLIKSGDYAREDTSVLPSYREIRLFDLPASAGTGEFLDSDNFEMIEVGNEVAPEADFGIRIHGDSMEPRYINGQIVWVQQTEELESGEIGIFYLDGNAYCKKLDCSRVGTFLVSLNQKYAPIQITKNNSFKIFGKVVC